MLLDWLVGWLMVFNATFNKFEKQKIKNIYLMACQA
jgi:hypothetical protein